jgi:hypothetical protein
MTDNARQGQQDRAYKASMTRSYEPTMVVKYDYLHHLQVPELKQVDDEINRQ